MRQLFNWGSGNANKAIKKPEMFAIHDIVLPPLILASLIALVFILPLSLFAILLLVGFGLIFAITLTQENLRNSIIFTLTFPIHFLSYTIGLLYGMVSGSVAKILK